MLPRELRLIAQALGVCFKLLDRPRPSLLPHTPLAKGSIPFEYGHLARVEVLGSGCRLGSGNVRARPMISRNVLVVTDPSCHVSS